MLNEAQALTREYAMLAPGNHILCAVSGGADSVCLLHWLKAQSEALGFALTAAHFNHRLRGAESDRDAAFVEQLCREWKVPCVVGTGDVSGEAERRGAGIEETARTLRYAFLEQTAAEVGADLIATAHNANDNVETMLLHLIRGSGLQGLTGIRPRRRKLIRPFLTTTRAEILAYLEEHRLPHVEDSTNADTAYARNRLRHQVIPLLEELNPALISRLSDTVGYLRADNDYLTAQAMAAVRGAEPTVTGGLVLPADAIARSPDPIAVRAVSALLGRLGEHQYRSAHLLSVVDLARSGHPSGSVDLPHGITARRAYGLLVLEPTAAESGWTPVPLNVPGETPLPQLGWKLVCRPVQAPAEPPTDPFVCYLDPSALDGPLTVRPRETGDGITLPGRPHKSVKKLLIDAKVPRADRERLPVVADRRGPVWLGGFRPDVPRLAIPGAPALELRAVPLAPATQCETAPTTGTHSKEGRI